MTIRDVLIEARSLKQPLEIYANQRYTDSFLCGWVLELSDDYLSMVEVDSAGRIDSNAILRLDDIFKVGLNSQYLRAVVERASLVSSRVAGRRCPADLQTALRKLSAARSVGHVSFIWDEKVPVWILDCADDHVRYAVLDLTGESTGEEICHIDSIIKVQFGGSLERAIQNRASPKALS